MKKTWTTRILIALLTLAMVAGVFGAAPKAALAAGESFSLNGDDTVAKGSSGNFYVNITNPDAAITYQYKFTGGTLSDTISTSNNRNISFDTAGATTVKCEIFSDAAGTNKLGEVSKAVSVTSAPTAFAPTSFASWKVGEAISGASLSATGAYPDSITWTQVSGTLPAGVSFSNGTFSGTPTASTAGAVSIGIKAANSAGTYQGTVDVTVAKAASNVKITNPTSAYEMSAGESLVLTASSNNTTGTMTWAKDATAVGTGTSYTFSPTTADVGTYTFKVTQAASTDGQYEANTTGATVSVTVKQSKPNLTVSPASKTVSYNSGAFTLTASSSNTATVPTWTLAGPGTLSVANGTAAWSVSYTPPTSGSTTQTATITVNQVAGGSYRDATATATITMAPQFDLTTTSITTKVGYTGTTFGVTTGSNATVTATSNNTKVATVSPATSTGSGHVFTVSPVAAGDTTITVTDGATTKSVSVHVQSQYPVITAQFWSSDNCTTNLNKTYNWGTLRITVKDYNPSNPYVTVTRSNIRTYIQSGTNSHPSTYTYTAYLTQSGTDGVVDLYVIPQYNGTTYYSVAYSGATTVNSPTIYVSGYTTLPQTGPDYTWAYVLGGLCLITAATAVTLNVRKKKREEI